MADTIYPRGTGETYLTHRGAQGMAVSIIFTSLATFFVLARLYTRIQLMKRMEANDWMILVALAFSFVFMGLYIVEALNGMGMHGVAIPGHILMKQMKAFWATIPFYNAAVLCAKATILMQYFRVFPTKRMRIISCTMITVLATYGTWCVISAFLNCVPVAKFWNPSIQGGFCLSSTGLWFSNASMHIVTDLAILAIPVPALVALDLPKRQKMALIAIFALGGFVCITSICRLVALKKISDSADPTYDNVGAASWSAVECNIGIICACLPTLRPLISRIFPRLLSTVPGADYSSHGYGYGASPLSRGQVPTYWNGMGRESIAGTHPRDVERGADADADEVQRVMRLVLERSGVDMPKEARHYKEVVVKTEASSDYSVSSSK